MDADNTVCPVCTLYLRPGITLKSHLSSHPKQKVIEALVRLSATELPTPKDNKNVASTSGCFGGGEGAPPPPPNFAVPPGGGANHSFIYQQFMSTSSPPQANVLNVNPLTQQYVTIPTVFSPPMMCPPYVYHQQQQVIMSRYGACAFLFVFSQLFVAPSVGNFHKMALQLSFYCTYFNGKKHTVSKFINSKANSFYVFVVLLNVKT